MGYDSDRFEIMRTVEMETWTESRLAHHNAVIGTDNRALSPDDDIEMKRDPVVYTSTASGKSSTSLGRVESPVDVGRAF